MPTKEYLQEIVNFERQQRGKDAELFRDRAPITPGFEEVAPEGTTVDPEAVSSALVREVLLGAIGNLQGKVRTDRFSNMDAQQLEKLLELVKDWPTLQKAVDDLRDWGAHQTAKEQAAASSVPPVRENVRKLRVLLDKLPGGEPMPKPPKPPKTPVK